MAVQSTPDENEFEYQNILDNVDNVRLTDDEMLQEINDTVVEAGQQLATQNKKGGKSPYA